MPIPLNETHDPSRKSFVESANAPGCDFPIQNLPFGIFRPAAGEPPRARCRHRRSNSRCRGGGGILRRTRGGGGAVRCPVPYAQSSDVAWAAGLVGAAARAVARPEHRAWRREAAPASDADGAGGDATAGGDRRLHRFLCFDLSRQQCRAHVPPRQSADAELQIRAGRLSQPHLVDPRQRHAVQAAARPAQGSERGGAELRTVAQSRFRARARHLHRHRRASSANRFRSAGRRSTFSASACSTTGRRAISRPGNISRSVRSSARISPPRSRPGW